MYVYIYIYIYIYTHTHYNITTFMIMTYSIIHDYAGSRPKDPAAAHASAAPLPAAAPEQPGPY